jgi:hypothetical protein
MADGFVFLGLDRLDLYFEIKGINLAYNKLKLLIVQ